MKLTRRSLLAGAGGAGLGAGAGSVFGGCARPFGEDTPPSALEVETMYIDLPPGFDDFEITLEVADRRYPLQRLDATSRARERREHPYARTLGDEQLEGYVAKAEFSAVSTQIFTVTYRTKGAHSGGMRGLLHAGIHIAHAGLAEAHRIMGPDWHPRPGELAELRQRVGPDASLDDADVGAFVDMTDSAHFAVFHHPELISLDAATAAIVISIIDGLPELQAVKDAIKARGPAQGPDSDYVGWANAEYVRDSRGNRIQRLDVDGDPVFDEQGQPVWQFAWIPDRSVQIAAGAAIRKALRLVRDTPQLENRTWVADDGLPSIVNGVDPAQVVASATYDVALANNGKVQYGQSVQLLNVDGRTVTLKVANTFFRHLGVWVSFKDADDVVVPVGDGSGAKSPYDTPTMRYLGLVGPPPRILGIPVREESSAVFTVTLPDGASKIALLTSSAYFSGSGDYQPAYRGVEEPGTAMTWSFEIGLPIFFLALGGVTPAFKDALGELVVVAQPVVIQLAIADSLADRLRSANSDTGVTIAAAFVNEIFSRAVGTAVGKVLIRLSGRAAAERAAAAASPLVGWIVYGVFAAVTLAEVITTTVDIAKSKRCVETVATFAHTLKVRISTDDTRFPQSATSVAVRALFSKTNTMEDTLAFEPASAGTVIEHVFASKVPTGGDVTVAVAFLSKTGWIAGQGTAVVRNVLPEGSTELVVDITIEQNLVPLTETTRYFHLKKLAVVSGAHQWEATAIAPTATRGALDCRAAAAALCLPSAITYNSKLGQLAYAYQAATPALATCGQSNTGSQVFMIQGLNDAPGVGDGSPDAALKVMSCGYVKPVHVVYDLLGGVTGQHFVLVPAATGYTLRKITLGLDNNFPTIEQLPILGTFSSDRIACVRYHTAGYVVALNSDYDKLEILPVSEVSVLEGREPRQADLVGGRGRLKGLTDGAVAIACTFSGRTLLVLEAGNRRLQAFDDNGNPTPYFGEEGAKTYFAPLRGDELVTYLDLAIESTGYIYVLSVAGDASAVANYRLDIYEPTGKFLARTEGVAAAKLAVDLWRNVFTLNFEQILGPKARTEPSVSQWIPSTP